MTDFDSKFVPLDKQLHDRGGFDCGEPQISNFIQRLALQHTKKGLSQTYVLATKEPTSNSKAGIIAFYSLSSSLIFNEEFKLEDAAKLPRHPIPAILIGQLGVHKEYQGNGLGSVALVTALKNAYRISLQLGAYAVLVDCINDSITRLYESFGFSYLDSMGGKVRMFLPMSSIKQLM